MGIVKGDTETTINPQGDLTREQAAKLVTYAAVGATVADKLAAANDPFDDVAATRWSAGYISYCVAQGIINGDGNGKFRPTDNVTGYEFAKMMLCVLGYGKNDEYTGKSWSVNVAKDALSANINLFKGVLDAASNEPINREEAFQVVFNTITGPETVVFSKDTESYQDANALASNTLAETVFGYNTASNIVTANSYNTADTTTTTVNSVVYNINTGADVYGHYVTVYYKTTGAKGVAYSVVDETITVDITPTMTAAQVKAALTDAGFTNDLSFETMYQNGASTASTITVTLGTSTGASLIPAGAASVTLYGYATAGGVVAYGYSIPDTGRATYIAAVDTTEGSESITIGVTKYDNKSDSDKVNEYDGIAKGDIVVDVVCGTDATAVHNLTKTTTVSGAVSAKVSTQYKQSITLDGTVYSVNETAIATAAALNPVNVSNINLGSVVVGGNYTLYLDSANKVVAIVAVDDSSDAGLFYLTYAYTVSGSANAYGALGADTYFVQGVDTTGAEVKYQVKQAVYKTLLTDTDDVASTYDATNDGLFTVTTLFGNDSDTNVKATYATLNNTPTGANIGSGDTAIDTTDKSIAANNYYASDVKFIYVSGDRTTLVATVKEGIQATTTQNYAYYGTAVAGTSNYTVKYVFVAGTAPTATAGTGVILVVNNFTTDSEVSYTLANGSTGTAYSENVYLDGVAKTITVTDATTTAGFYSYDVDDTTGLYTLTSLTDGTDGVYTAQTISNLYNGLLTTTGTRYVTDIDASSAVVVNTTRNTDAATTLAGIVADNTHTYTVQIVTDTTGTAPVVTYVYITQIVCVA
jgi:hypothetical protein